MNNHPSVTDSLLGINNNANYSFVTKSSNNNDNGNNGNNSNVKSNKNSPFSTKAPQSVTQHSSSGSSSSLGGLISCVSELQPPQPMITNYENDDLLSIAPSSSSSLSLTSNNTNNSLKRHLTLLDLMSIGVAATVGSGIFVLCGLIAHDYAGPSTFICWGIAGLSCCASGLCYAELSGKFAVSGSTYTYVVSAAFFKKRSLLLMIFFAFNFFTVLTMYFSLPLSK